MTDTEITKSIGNDEILPLTGLRFAAAFYVFLFHLQIRWPLTEQPFLKQLLDQGAVGMSVFFMLSGFVLAYRYMDGRTSLRHYAISRFARIYPIYVMAALLTLPWMGIAPHDAYAGLKLGGLILADTLLIQAWFPWSIDFWNNGASWSISVEAFFYALLPLLLRRLKTLRERDLWKVMLLCYGMLVSCGLLTLVLPVWSIRLFYSVPLFRLPEFIIGIGICMLFVRGKTRWLDGSRVQYMLLAGALLYLALLGGIARGYVIHHWLIVPLIAMLLLSLAKREGAVAWFLSRPLALWLGRISYCFYSFQPVVLLPLVTHHARIVEAYPALADARVMGIVAFIMLLVLAATGYHLIEAPMRRRILRKQR